MGKSSMDRFFVIKKADCRGKAESRLRKRGKSQGIRPSNRAGRGRSGALSRQEWRRKEEGRPSRILRPSWEGRNRCRQSPSRLHKQRETAGRTRSGSEVTETTPAMSNSVGRIRDVERTIGSPRAIISGCVRRSEARVKVHHSSVCRDQGTLRYNFGGKQGGTS